MFQRELLLWSGNIDLISRGKCARAHQNLYRVTGGKIGRRGTGPSNIPNSILCFVWKGNEQVVVRFWTENGRHHHTSCSTLKTPLKGTNIWSLLDCNSPYLHVAHSHVQSALNRTLIQLPNQIHFCFLLSSFPVSAPLHASKRLLLSVCSYLLCSFLLRFPCFIFLFLFPLHFLLVICCRSLLAPTIFLYFLFCFLFRPLFISFSQPHWL